MGRTREYDEEAVLTGAMHAFRRKGYFSVSIKDLEKATGLKGGSIYNSFGDKAGLFAAAFARYNEKILGQRITNHAPDSAGLNGVRALFLSLLKEPGGESFGCLITNSAIEFGGEDAPMPGAVNAAFKILQTTFAKRLTVASESGLLRTGVDPLIAAMKLLALYQGILVLVRSDYSKAALKVLINNEFDNLEETGHVP